MTDELRLRKLYPSDASDEEWAFVAPNLPLIGPDVPQHRYDLPEVITVVRWIARTDAPWRSSPTDFPPWEAASQQA